MLADPNFCKIVAELLAAGKSRRVIIEELQDMDYDVKDEDTISRWRKDARVKTLVQQLNADRAVEISRKIDARIAGILSNEGRDVSIKELVMIRKEYGGTSVAKTEVDESVTEEAMKALSDPSFVEALEKLEAMDRRKKQEKAAAGA